MAEDQLRIEKSLKTTNHVQTPEPSIVVPRKSTMRMPELVILSNMELVRSPDKSAIFLEIHLHDNKTWRVAWRMIQCDTLEEIKLRLVECLPFQSFQGHVVREIYSEICLRGYSPAGVLELFFVDINRNVGVYEVLKAACVVEMEMAYDDSLDILDVVSCGFYCGGKLVFFGVFSASEDIRKRSAPFLLNCKAMQLPECKTSLTTSTSSAQPVS